MKYAQILIVVLGMFGIAYLGAKMSPKELSESQIEKAVQQCQMAKGTLRFEFYSKTQVRVRRTVCHTGHGALIATNEH